MCPFIQCTFLSLFSIWSSVLITLTVHAIPIFLRFKVLTKLLGCIEYNNKKCSWKYHENMTIYAGVIRYHNWFWRNELKRSTYTSTRINNRKIIYKICTGTVQITKSHTKPISIKENATEGEELCRKILALAQFFVAKICTNYKAWWDTRLQDHLVPIPKSAHFPHLQWCEERYEE